MSHHPTTTIAPDHIETERGTRPIADEIRELRKLALDRRVASLTLFHNKGHETAMPSDRMPLHRHVRTAA